MTQMKGMNWQFQKRVKFFLDEIDANTLVYNENEFWMIQSAYEFVEFYAIRHQLLNTAIALPLARGLHNGDYRKSVLIRGEVNHRVPYIIHPLMVCKMLIELRPQLSTEELDILLAAALCHDMIEDIPFLEHGKELTLLYHLHPRVYDTVCKVSKRRDFSEEEELKHFEEISKDKLAALIKLTDRGNNVEDLYNMSAWKVHEYVNETRKFLLPICEYGKINFPDLTQVFLILEDKLLCLTNAAEQLVNRYEENEKQLCAQLEKLTQENQELRNIWNNMWKMEV